METEIEVKKVEAEPRRSIPAIALTAVAMTLALTAIIVAQKYLNAPSEHQHPVEQTQVR
jgi:hypothetical protein